MTSFFRIMAVSVFVVSCSSTPKNPVVDPLLKSIKIGTMENMDFDGHVGKPLYTAGQVQEYVCPEAPQDKELHATSTNEDYVSFFCYHYEKYISYVEGLFQQKISFRSQAEYSSIQILWGDSIYQTSPEVFVIRKDHPIDANVVYHELGHRLSYLLTDSLNIPFEKSDYLMVGIVDYLAASISEEPVIGKRFVPASLVRDVRVSKKFPKEQVSFRELIAKLKKVYAGDFKTKPYHKKFIDALEKMAKENKNLMEGHATGMLVAHPLWRLREKFGAVVMDKVLAEAILKLSDLKKFRMQYLFVNPEVASEPHVAWFDFFTALLVTSQEMDSTGVVCATAKTYAEESGFPLKKYTSVDCRKVTASRF